MSDDILNFEERRRERDEDLNLSRCAHCGKMIVATSIRCPECGVHFQGEAQDFTQADKSGGPRRARRTWVVAATVIIVLALLLSAAGKW
jgi:hypothetical protein